MGSRVYSNHSCKALKERHMKRRSLSRSFQGDQEGKASTPLRTSTLTMSAIDPTVKAFILPSSISLLTTILGKQRSRSLRRTSRKIMIVTTKVFLREKSQQVLRRKGKSL